MRVVCITQKWHEGKENIGAPRPKKGDVCTVIETRKHTQNPSELMYVLLEYPNNYSYLAKHFIAINEDQQDETEMERSYGKQHA